MDFSPPPTDESSGFLGPADHKGTACIGCRLRRKKCDKKKPICTGCSDLQIPRELCIYRKMGLASKDSKATLTKEIKKNRELKDDQERAVAVFKYNKKSTGSPQDYYYLKDTRHGQSFKHFQLNPEKNPLLCTVMMAPQTTAYLGSISVAAITEAEPQMKLLLQQIHRVIMKEKVIYERRVTDESKNKNPGKEAIVDAFNEHCKATLVGMGNVDGDGSIRELIQDIEQNFPSKQAADYALQIFFRQNTNRFTLFPYVDEHSFRAKYAEYVKFKSDGSVKFKLDLPYEAERLVFVAWVLSIMALAAFCFHQSGDPFEMDYVLYSKYAHALTRIDLVGKKIRLGEQSIGPDFIALKYSLLLLEKYTASAGFMENMDQICEATLNIRLLVTMAMSVNLNKDLDRFYPIATLGEKKQMKTLWYTLVLYETFESMDVGFISKFEPASFRRYDYCYNGVIEAVHILHSVLFNYNMIDDMGKTDDLIEFMENNLIRRLKRLLKEEFKTMEEDMNTLQNCDLDDLSKENLDEYGMMMQRLAMRYVILATILAFYHVGYKRLEQVGEGDSLLARRYRMLGWKYSLTIETLFREMWVGYNRLGNHKNYFEFYPVSSLMLMAPVMRFAQRRVTLFATSRFLTMVSVDEQLIVNHVLYGNDQHNAAILKTLEASGDLSKLYTLKDFDNMDVDDNYGELMAKFGELNSLKFLVMSLSKVMSDSLALMHTGKTTFNFMKLSKIFHVLLLRLCSFLLVYTMQEDQDVTTQNGHIAVYQIPGSPQQVNSTTEIEEPKFDFRNFFAAGQDVTVDDDEIFELFNMTSRNRFW